MGLFLFVLVCSIWRSHTIAKALEVPSGHEGHLSSLVPNEEETLSQRQSVEIAANGEAHFKTTESSLSSRQIMRREASLKQEQGQQNREIDSWSGPAESIDNGGDIRGPAPRHKKRWVSESGQAARDQASRSRFPATDGGSSSRWSRAVPGMPPVAAASPPAHMHSPPPGAPGAPGMNGPNIVHAASGMNGPKNDQAKGEIDSESTKNDKGKPLPMGVQKDGILRVSKVISDENDRRIAEEDNFVCLDDEKLPVEQCMEKFGSYGIRRLYTESFSDIKAMKWERPDWMAHDEVQKAPIFSLTLPMTHASGSYYVQEAPGVKDFSASTQSLTTWEQLRLGVRAFDLPIAIDVQANRLHTASNGHLTASLRTVLNDLKRFLSRNTKEVVFVFASKAVLSSTTQQAQLPSASIAPLIQEETNPSTLPGQMVHQAFEAVLGNFLGTYPKLSSLKDYINPKVSDLVQASARIIYFWEGQQVLCTSLAACRLTPGWSQSPSATPFAFGEPKILGQRPLEPSCLGASLPVTQDADPSTLAKKLKAFAIDPGLAAARAPLPCYASGQHLPRAHLPNVLYKLDAYLTPTPKMIAELDKKLRAAPVEGELYTHGEALTLRSAAERMNLLLLSVLFGGKRTPKAIFLRPNLIAMDFVTPISVHRIVEAMQKQKECGYAFYCKETGSCFAMSALDGISGKCLERGYFSVSALDILKLHVNPPSYISATALLFMLTATIATVFIVRQYCEYAMFPSYETNYDFYGFLWYRIYAGNQKDETQDADGVQQEDETMKAGGTDGQVQGDEAEKPKEG